MTVGDVWKRSLSIVVEDGILENMVVLTSVFDFEVRVLNTRGKGK